MSTTPAPINNDPIAPPTTNPAAPAIDLSGLASPGASVIAGQPAPNVQTALQGSMSEAVANQAAAAKRAADLANQPVSTPDAGGHSRLLKMVQGLADGLSSFGTAISTKGREGGSPEVQQLEAGRQQQKQQEQAAAMAQRNEQIQQQLTIGNTNQSLAQSYLNLLTLPDEITKQHLGTQSAELGVIGQAQDIRTKALQDFVTTGDMSAYNETLQKLGAASGTATGTTAASGAPAVTIPPAALATWKNATDSAVSAYPADPAIKNFAAVLADPKSTSQQMAQAAAGAKNRMQSLDTGIESQTRQEAAAAGARPKDLNDATGRLAQAQAAYSKNPTPENKSAVDNSKAAQSAFLTADRQQKQIAQDIQNGDPNVIGAAMANGLYAPSQVLSARSMSKPFYSKVIAAANDAAKASGAPEILGSNGQHTGQYFDAARAEAQFKYSASVQTQNTLNKILTLNEPGGDLDILKDAITALPKMNQKTLNKIFNAGATEFGSPEATNYHMALYNLAGLLAQVQTGGIPTEGEIQTQLTLMSDANSKGQLDGALQIARKDIAARGNSMVANNPYLRAAYPTLAQAPQPATQTINHKVGDQIIQNGHNFVVTAVDNAGRVTAANPSGAR